MFTFTFNELLKSCTTPKNFYYLKETATLILGRILNAILSRV